MELKILTLRNFSFHRTIISHGWCELLPFEIERDRWRLTRVIDLGKKPPVTIIMTATKRFVRVTTTRRLGKADTREVVRATGHILRLDDDMEHFYRATSADPGFEWIARQGAGRMLRSPTVFEDLVKMICTTNCSWALTEKMVNGLVSELGTASDDGRKSFPSAAAMAAQSAEFYRDKIRAGYRSPYLKELAQRVASGELDAESWLTTDASLADLTKEIKSVKGVGNYAAENLLKLIGRYDGLALDSWARAQFAKARMVVAWRATKKFCVSILASIPGAV